MKDKIKVLMLVPNMKIANGVASFAMNYFRGVNHEKIHIDFVAFQDGPSPYYEEIQLANSQCYKMTSFKHFILHIKECVSILKKGDYDIIHDNTLLVSIPLMWIAKKMKVPVRILHSHSSGLGETPLRAIRNKLFLPLLKSLATDFSACSEKAATNLFGNCEYNFIPSILCENKLIFSNEKRIEIRKKEGVENKTVIGTVGRVAPPKNPMFALEVIKEMTGKLDGIEYWWIGGGPLEEVFKRRVKELNLSDVVRFFGSRDDVGDLYQAMDIFLMPSKFEGLGMAALEAQAMGLPCVVSDAIPREADYTGNVKRLSLNYSPKEWSREIISSLERKHERKSYLKDLKSSSFSGETAGAQLEEYYVQMLKDREDSNGDSL